MNAFISEQPSRARLFDERRNDGVSVRGEERSRKRCAVRDDEVCVRRTDDARIEIYIVYLFRKFYVSPSPDRTAHSHVFHLRTNQKQSAATAVCKKEISLTA